MRNKLFATAKGVISLSWCIAGLFLFVAVAANGTLSASTIPQISAGLQSSPPPLSPSQRGTGGGFSGGCPEHFDSISRIEPATGKSVGWVERSETQQSNPKSEIPNPQLDRAAFAQKTKKLQIPFIANDGQTDERVRFYANTFGGTVFVTKEGEIVYALPNNSSELGVENLKSEAGRQKPENRWKKSEARIQDNSGSCIVDCASVENRTSDIVHSALCIVDQDSKSEFQNLSPTSIGEPKSGVALREEFVGSRIKTIHGEDPSVTKVNYFKGNDPEKWKNNISTYDFVNLGEIYKGIELKLKAYGDNVEKLFCVKPGTSPEKIQVQLNGAKSLQINEEGQLVAETELGPVKFTKPVAYQEIDGKRMEVGVEYSIQKSESRNQKPEVRSQKQDTRGKRLISSKEKGMGRKCAYITSNPQFSTSNPKSAIRNPISEHPQLEYGFKVASYDKTKELVIDPLLASTYLGGSDYEAGKSIALDGSGNVYVTGYTYSSDFPTTSGAYDTSFNSGLTDIFISKMDSSLSSLQASTYLGGSSYDGQSTYYTSVDIALDGSGNVYVTGITSSSNFPTTNGSYDTLLNGGSDVFISKLDSSLTNLQASTLLGGSDWDIGTAIALDASGNVYVTGHTGSSDFPATSNAYDTSSNGWPDIFISKLDSSLSSLMASTYLGGSSYDGQSASNASSYVAIALDSSSNVYVTGLTYSSDFPTTSGAYDNSLNGSSDVFISKLDSSLSSLQASTFLGGSNEETCKAIAMDASGNVYVTGLTYSSDFPTTSEAYDTSLGSNADAFVSKMNGGLTSLLASTYLGGSNGDNGGGIALLDGSGKVYVVGFAYGGFPTTTGAYDTSSNGYGDVFISKLDSLLSSLQASTYLGGSGYDYSDAIALDASGNVYVTGSTGSEGGRKDFPTTSGAYNTSGNGGTDAFIVKFDSGLLSALIPTAVTSTASNVTESSATLNGTVNAKGLSTTAWFEYGMTSGSYTNTTSAQGVGGSSATSVSASINGLSSNTTYYYRMVAQNSAGTSYGSEASFTTSAPSDTTAPTGSLNINSGASYTNSTAVTLTLSATDNVGVMAYYLSTSSSTPSASASGWTSVTSTTSYSGTVSYSLSSGEGSKTIYAWYKDAAGNVSSSANATITLDTTVPTVTISSPTSNSTYTSTSSTISLGGSASDSSSGISSVAWSNNRGGNGTATGTASWTVSSISLSTGDNVITVTAKDGANNSGTDTVQVTYGTPTTVSAPTVSTGSASSVTTSSAILNGTVNANGGTTTAWFQYGSTSGSYGNTSSTQTVTGSSNTTVSIGISGLSSGTTYYYRIAATNSAGTSYGSEANFTTSSTTTTTTPTPTPTPSTTDTTAPTNGSIIINSGASYTNSTTVTLSLSATDNTGVTAYYLSTSSSTPSSSASGWTSVSSTTSYSGSVSYTLSGGEGSKTVYVWFKDSSGNVSSSASDDITLDTTAPTINITSPTSDATYTATSSTISLGGSASDSTSGIKEVTWTNSSGGSGTASGTTSWTISGISLSNGDNTITVTAKDNAGNTSTDTITVTYKSSSTNVPKVSTGSATNITETSATLSGTVNANGLTTTAWFNYGTTSGLYSSTSSTKTISGSSDTAVSISISGLSAGTKYYYKLSAQNSAGTSTGSEASFTTKTLSPTPSPSITPPPTLPPLPTPPGPTPPPLPSPSPVVSPSPVQGGSIFGDVKDGDGYPLQGITVTITGDNFTDSTDTDGNGKYEFRGLAAGDYTLRYKKDGYQTQTKSVSLEEGEVKDLGTLTMEEQAMLGKIYGYVVDIRGNPIESVKLKLKGIKTKLKMAETSDGDGFFEFTDLEADTYVISAQKKRYRNAKKTVSLEEGEEKEIEIEMRKSSKRVIEMMEDGQ